MVADDSQLQPQGNEMHRTTIFAFSIAIAITTHAQGLREHLQEPPIRLVRSAAPVMFQEQGDDIQVELLAAVRSLTSKIEQMNTDNLIRSSSDACGGVSQFSLSDQYEFAPQIRRGATFPHIPSIDVNNSQTHAVPRVIHIDGKPQLFLDPEPVPLLRVILGRLRLL